MSRFLIDLAARILPPHRHDWGEAMRAEYAAIANPREAFDFALGCLWAALSERITVMKLITATGRIGVGTVSLLTGGTFLFGLPDMIQIALRLKPDPFYDMLVKYHHTQAAADHLHAYPYIFLFTLLMGVSYAGAGFFLIRWRPKAFAVFCTLAVIPAVSLTVAGMTHQPSHIMGYAWPFIPLALLIAAAIFLDWLGREPARPVAA